MYFLGTEVFFVFFVARISLSWERSIFQYMTLQCASWFLNEANHVPEENYFIMRTEIVGPRGKFPDLKDFRFIPR